MIKNIKNIKLTPFVAITLFVSLLLPTIISSYLLIAQEKQKQFDELNRFQNAVVTVFAASLAAPLWELRHDSAYNAIAPILNDDRVAFIQVLDYQTGELFIDEHNEGVGGNISIVSKEIVNNQTPIGLVKMGISDIHMKRNLEDAIFSVVMIFLFQLFISAIILTFAIYKKIISPIYRLTDEAKQLSNNQFDQEFSWNREDEIGKLGESFEYARTSLQETFKKIDLQRKRLEYIIEGTNVGTWEWNIKTGETIFNEKWAQMIGYSLEEISPTSIKTWMEFAHPDDLEKSNLALQKHFDAESDYYECESRMKHKEGHWIWALDRGVVTKRDENGKPLYMSGTHQDITQKKLQEIELAKLNQTLQEEIAKQVDDITKKDKILQEQAKLAAMGEMIGAIAHQWRQPLNALNINIQNLEDDYEDGLVNEEFIKQFSQKQIDTIQFMSKTIDDFRNFFRTDKQKQIFSIREVALTVKKLLQAQLKSHNIALNINEDDFIIDGYKGEMQQVLLNIISNSKDAILENDIHEGFINIQINTKEKKIYIYDNGGGMDDLITDKIFEPYFTTKEQGKGTGIGLHISRIIILEHMKGNIRAFNLDDGLCTEIELREAAVENA